MRRRQIYAAMALKELTPEGFMGGPLLVSPETGQEMTPVEPFGEGSPTYVGERIDFGCPKCGRVIGRGRAMHEKHCKGK